MVVLPEQRAVGTGSGPAPGQSRRYREVVHAQRGRLSPGLLGLWQWAGGEVAWSLLLIHLPGRQLEDKESGSPTVHTANFISNTYNTQTQNLHLFQWRLPGFLWDAELTAAGRSLWLRGGVSTLQVAPLQFLRVAAPPWGTWGSQGGVPAFFTPGGGGPWWRWEPKINGGLIELLFLDQQGVAAGGGA